MSGGPHVLELGSVQPQYWQADGGQNSKRSKALVTWVSTPAHDRLKQSARLEGQSPE